MKQPLTTITLHGILGEAVGQKTWNLVINRVGEAFHAIEILSKRKLYKFLYDNDKKGVGYKVIINGKEFVPPENFTVENPKALINNELTIKKELKSIDIVPVIQGADSDTMNWVNIILGTILIIVGVVLSAFYGSGVPLIAAGIGLLSSGIMGLLNKPPDPEKYQDIKGGAVSYLFNGPENTSREGMPVPVVYGRLIVGSQTISASYETNYRDASTSPITY